MIKFFKKLLLFAKMKIFDVKNPPLKSPNGIFCYVGRPGFGKTISMVEHMIRLKKEFPKAKIYTNFGLSFQDGEIKAVEDFTKLKNGTDGIIFGFDEIHKTFNSRFWVNFPPEMLSVVAQNRKQCKMFVCSAQSFDSIEKTFRKVCNYIIECRNIGRRWVFQRAFEPEDYKEKDGEYKPRKRAFRYSFVADNFIYNCYDTMKVIDALEAMTENSVKSKARR